MTTGRKSCTARWRTRRCAVKDDARESSSRPGESIKQAGYTDANLSLSTRCTSACNTGGDHIRVNIELEHNPVCRHRRAFDVNGNRPLPWPDASFDALLIHAASEYVCEPERLFDEIHRLLSPGGRLIVSFSDHFLPQSNPGLGTDPALRATGAGAGLAAQAGRLFKLREQFAVRTTASRRGSPLPTAKGLRPGCCSLGRADLNPAAGCISRMDRSL